MPNKELRKISDKLFKKDRDMDSGYRSFRRRVLLDIAISIGFIVSVSISFIIFV